MTTLAADIARIKVLGDVNEFPVIASDIIYEGAAVGLVAATGHAQPLTSSDRFVGFAERKADNSAGAAAAINVRVVKKGVVQIPVTGAVITDVGQPVYAQDDNAFSFIKTSGVFIGFVRRYVSSGVAEVEFDAGVMVDPHEGWLAETTAVDLTLDEQDTGKVIFVTADAKTVLLGAAATVGIRVRIVNAGAFGAQLLTVDCNAADGIKTPNAAQTADGVAITNTKATACRGDYVELCYGDPTAWAVRTRKGIWA